MTDADILRLAAHWQAYRDSKEPTLRGADAILAFAHAVASATLIDLSLKTGVMVHVEPALMAAPQDPVEHEGATCD